jgi:hypothetical protein
MAVWNDEVEAFRPCEGELEWAAMNEDERGAKKIMSVYI